MPQPRVVWGGVACVVQSGRASQVEGAVAGGGERL